MFRSIGAALAAVVVSWAGAAQAGPDIFHVIEKFDTATTNGQLGLADRPFTRIIDQTGLGQPYVSGETYFETFLRDVSASACGGCGVVTIVKGAEPIFIDFGFNNPTFVNGIGFYGNGTVRTFDLYASDTADFTSKTLLGSYTATSTTLGWPWGKAMTFDALTTRYIRLAVTSTSPGSVIVIDEVFARSGNEIAVVPEPATWAMMIFGFGLAGSALRKRRSDIAAADLHLRMVTPHHVPR